MRRHWTAMDRFTKACAAWMSLMVLLAFIGPFLPLPDPREADFEASAVGLFSPGHVLGTDSNGYDLLSNVVNGARTSLMIAFVSVVVGGALGAAIGIVSAYRRGRLDAVVNLFFNIVLSIPNLVLGLALVAILATSSDPSVVISPSRRVVVIMIALTFVVVPVLGRIARGATLTWINREFVVAARSMGMRDRHIILRHIVPNVLPAIYSVGFLAIGVVIVAEGALSLLGVGVVDGVSWGAMISRVAGEFTLVPHSMYVPVTVLALTVIASNQLGDHLRSRLDLREGRL
ncbi:MAG: ABC transporter permease [Actinobacteria bacterium]|nr:ABC transporter permease [Actinomycetota bacterium]